MRNRISGDANVGGGVFKNAAILFTIILISVGCADSSAQSTNQDGSKLVGTWVAVISDDKKMVSDGETWVFNSDGTGTYSGIPDDRRFKYAAIAGKVHMRGCSVNADDNCYSGWGTYGDFVVSNDGKNLFRYMNNSDRDRRVWLLKGSGK
jgi:hypothetical protein